MIFTKNFFRLCESDQAAIVESHNPRNAKMNWWEEWRKHYWCDALAAAEAVWILNKLAKKLGDKSLYCLKDRWLSLQKPVVARVARVEGGETYDDDDEDCRFGYWTLERTLYEYEFRIARRLYQFHSYQQPKVLTEGSGTAYWNAKVEYTQRLPSGWADVNPSELRDRLSSVLSTWFERRGLIETGGIWYTRGELRARKAKCKREEKEREKKKREREKARQRRIDGRAKCDPAYLNNTELTDSDIEKLQKRLETGEPVVLCSSWTGQIIDGTLRVGGCQIPPENLTKWLRNRGYRHGVQNHWREIRRHRKNQLALA